MGICINNIKIGYEYQTPNNQDRLVLGFDKSGRVVYASRGGNVRNEYNARYACKKERFAKACGQRGSKFKATALKTIIKALNADVLLGKSAPKKGTK